MGQYYAAQIAPYWTDLDNQPRGFLPKKEERGHGPDGVKASYNWEVAKDELTRHLLQVTLLNVVASY